jgi:hypothetical protein
VRSPEPVADASPHVRVVAIDAQDPSWTRFVNAHPRATPYHSLLWRDIFQDSFGYRSWYLLAIDEQTGDSIGALPLHVVASPFGRRLVAVPFRDRGGLLWTSDAAFAALVREAKRIGSELGAASVELKTVDAYPAALVSAAGLSERFYWVRSVVPLADFASMPLWERLGHKRRSPIRQAQEAGMVCDDATTDADTWYDLHLRTQQRLGLPPFPSSFFRKLLGTLVPCGAARLLIARRGGEALAATILLRHRSQVIYGYAASTEEGQRQGAGDFLLFSALQAAIAEGRDTFDMGSDAPSQEGLLFFKKRWFAVQAPIPTYSLGDAAGATVDSSSPRYRLVRKVFEYLPRPALRLAGRATKYFG